MIFESFKTGDEIHDRIVDAFIKREIINFTEESIISFLALTYPNVNANNIGKKIFRNLQKRRLTGA